MLSLRRHEREEEPIHEDSVLLVEDSPECQLVVSRVLAADATVKVAPDLATACRLLKSGGFALVLLDLTLPDGNGFELFSELRNLQGARRPRVIFMTGDAGVSNKLAGFSLGADDYIVKPFDPLELKARVLAHLRNRREIIEAAQVLEVGKMRMNMALGSVEVLSEDGVHKLEVTPTEFRLLILLTKNIGRILPRDQLHSLLSQVSSEAVDQTIDVHISKLRKKLTAFGYGVESIYGFGYRLTQS